MIRVNYLKRSAARRLCKFPGMTREQYDANLEALLALSRPILRMAPSHPDFAEMVAAFRSKGLAGAGLPELHDNNAIPARHA